MEKEYCVQTVHAPDLDRFTFTLLINGSVIICYDSEPVPDYGEKFYQQRDVLSNCASHRNNSSKISRIRIHPLSKDTDQRIGIRILRSLKNE